MKLFFSVFLFLSAINYSFADISLQELGLSNTTVPTEQDLVFDKEMKVRTSKLKTHETLGLITLGAMTATMFTGNSALSSNTHMSLGMTTAALYFTTAYYSLTAPKPSGIIDRGRIKWHKNLAWIHFPAMIITPILGYMYKKNEEDGKKHSALEKQHKTFA